LPFSAKAAVAIGSASVIVAYLALGGRREDNLADRGHGVAAEAAGETAA
jgi:hypothetical protein